MRKIDDTVGVIACAILGKVAQILPRKNIDPLKVKKILCQKYFGIGSMLNAIPLIRALREKFPNAKIIFLTIKSHRETIQISDMADEVITIRFDSLLQFVRDALKLIFYLMGCRVDISIDLEFFTKFPLIISFFTLAPVRIGLYQMRIRPRGILTHEVYYNPYRHISKIYFAYAASLGITSKPEYFESLLPSLKAVLREGMYSKFGLDSGKKSIVINVNTSELFKFRSWPLDYFVELLKLFLKYHPGYNYIMIGAGEDVEQVNEVCRKTATDGRLINVAGKTTIEELFALIEMADLVITSDSGPLHIASLYGRNLVAFFGPETPVVYGPLNKNSLVFYAEDLYCSPCLSVYNSKQSLYSESCVQNQCLLKFKPQEVHKKIEEVFLT